jgi:hypothetical protein
LILGVYAVLGLVRANHAFKILGTVGLRETSPHTELPPGRGDKTVPVFGWYVAAHFVWYSILSGLPAAVCIDAVTFVVTGRNVFFEPVAVLLSWLFTAAPGFEEELVPRMDLVVSGLCIGLYGPLVVIVLTKFVYLWATVLRGGAAILLSRPDPSIQTLTHELAERLGCREPVVKLTVGKGTMVHIRQPLLGRRPVIEVGEQARQFYTEEELAAVLAHELGL